MRTEQSLRCFLCRFFFHQRTNCFLISGGTGKGFTAAGSDATRESYFVKSPQHPTQLSFVNVTFLTYLPSAKNRPSKTTYRILLRNHGEATSCKEQVGSCKFGFKELRTVAAYREMFYPNPMYKSHLNFLTASSEIRRPNIMVSGQNSRYKACAVCRLSCLCPSYVD